MTSSGWAGGKSIPAILRKRLIPFSQEEKFQPANPTYIPKTISAFLKVAQKNEVFQLIYLYAIFLLTVSFK